MKTIKIGLIVIVLASIVFFVIRSLVSTEKVGKTRASGNSFIDKIQNEIQAIHLKPDHTIDKNYYNEVTYQINDFHKDHRLGKTKLENDQWKENLSKQLLAAYADKFTKQAFYVFNRSEWEISNLVFIRNEYRAVQNSPMLERNSSIDKKLNEIKNILSKYDEIVGFISSCKGYSFTNTGLSDQFPISNVTSLISRASNYRNNKLENSYVNNCSRLHADLQEIPQILFRVHVKYLDNLINSWSNMFSNYSSQKAYADGLYSVLEKKIDELNNEIYHVSNLGNEHNRLKLKWQKDGTNAYDHFE